MAKIILKEPKGPYSCIIDTEVMLVIIKEAFMGVRFETPGGECLAVSMRDGGFEVMYSADYEKHGFNAGVTEFKNGTVRIGQG